MTDISAFKQIIEQPDAPLPDYVPPRWTWLVGYKTQSGRFAYQIGVKSPLSKLRTYSLADARDAAESFGLPVKEYGPPEAFGRKPKSNPLPAATVDEFWRLVGGEDPGRLRAWLANRPNDVPALLKLLEGAEIAAQWRASP
jgi:hypothetical protein